MQIRSIDKEGLLPFLGWVRARQKGGKVWVSGFGSRVSGYTFRIQICMMCFWRRLVQVPGRVLSPRIKNIQEGFGLRNFGSWVSGFGFRVQRCVRCKMVKKSCARHDGSGPDKQRGGGWISGFDFRVSSCELRVWDFEFRVSGFGDRLSGAEVYGV